MIKIGHIPLVQLGRGHSLAGRPSGEADRTEIEQRAHAAAVNNVVLIDLYGIAAITASYFTAAIWPLWIASPLAVPEFFPILLNASPDHLDEIEIAVRSKRAAIWSVRGSGLVSFHAPRLVGALDRTLQQTLDLVVAYGEITAPRLHDLAPNSDVGASAWSNRLAALYQSRLLRRQKAGKQLMYAPAWKEITNG